MTSTRKWALALCLALSCLRYSNAQDVTGNLIYSTVNPPPSGSVYSWSGFTLTESGGGGLSGGNVPAYNGTLGQFMWGYTPGTIDYSMAVSSALSGTGLRVTGIQYGLEYFNQDYSRGTLSATWTLRDTSGKVLESYYHAMPQTVTGWTSFDVTKTFSSPYSLASVGTLSFSATGTDDRFWAGYYGPQIKNPYARLTYGTDPCDTNPLSSPTCAGFSSALASRTTAPVTTTETAATTQPATTTVIAPTATAAARTTTTSTSSNTSAATATSSSRPALVSPRLEAIVRSVNEAVSATVTATVQQSQEQSQAQAQAAQEMASSQSMNMSVPGAARSTQDTGSNDNPTSGFTRPGDPAVAARGLSSMPTQDIPVESRPQPRNVQPPAELAGGINVAAFQTSVDITAYTNVALRDAPFYAPREIYRGQQTVDNRQALRALGSDQRHQDMVNQQYRR